MLPWKCIFSHKYPNMNEQEQQRSQLTEVISLGKKQNYLTYAQINDLLPNIVDTDHFDIIIGMLEGMNITVFEHPPREDQLALLGSTEEVPEDVEEAAAVLASIDKETGRTVDPVRMYMREMGTVELLTREGEIRIAKRIEEGIFQVLKSLSNYPETIQIVLEDYSRVLKEEMRLSEIISGFADAEEEEAPPSTIGSMLEIDDEGVATANLEEDDDGEGGLAEVDEGPSLEQAKVYFDELEDCFNKAMASLKKNGRTHKKNRRITRCNV